MAAPTTAKPPRVRMLEPGLDEPTVNIAGVEVFDISKDPAERPEGFFDKLVLSYDSAKHEAPVTLDHATDGPAYGGISKLIRKGDLLLADLNDVPRSMATAIERKRYGKRSLEFYTNFQGKGPMLRAVSFLGASVPRIKGMAPVTFCSTDEPEIAEQSAPAVETFYEVTADPTPGTHGVIEQQATVGEMLGHQHHWYADAAGNGFTSPPATWEYGDLKVDPTGHFHAITGGKVQPAGDPSHTHDLYGLSINQENEPMAEINKATQPTAPAPAGEDIARFSEQIATLQGELKTAREQADTDRKAREEMKRTLDAVEAEGRDRNELVRFNEVFDKAQKEGRVTEPERPALLSTFKAIPFDPPVERFSEDGKAAKSARQLLLQSIAARTPVVTIRRGTVIENRDTKPANSGEQVETYSEVQSEDGGVTRYDRIKAYRDEQAKAGRKLSLADATIEFAGK